MTAVNVNKSNNISMIPEKSVISLLRSIPFIILFSVIMVGFDILQRPLMFLCRRSLNTMCFLVSYSVLFSLKLTGLRIRYPEVELPKKGPLLIVSNHQSLMDIAILFVLFRKFRPHFIAKRELTKWLPFVAFNLRHEGHVIIDRARGAEAVEILQHAAEDIASKEEALVLFPEGTRARDGKLKKFKRGGLFALMQSMEEATIVPVCINGAWKISAYKLLPVPSNIHVTVDIGDMGEMPKDMDAKKKYIDSVESWLQEELQK